MRVLLALLLALLFLLGMIFFGHCLECHVLGNEKCVPCDLLVETNPHGDIWYYPFVLKTKKCLGSCDTLDNPML